MEKKRVVVSAAEKTKMEKTEFFCLKSLVTVKRTREIEAEVKF